MSVQRGIRAIYKPWTDGGSPGFDLLLDDRVRIVGSGFETSEDAQDTAREIGKELALIIVGMDWEGGT